MQEQPAPVVRCLNVLEYLHEIPHNAVVITDPPYNQGYHYDKYDDSKGLDEYKEMVRKVFWGRRSVIVHYPEETITVLGQCLSGLNDVMAWVYPSNQAKQHRLVTWWNCKPDWRRTPQPYKNPTDKRVKRLIAAGQQARGYDWVEINHVKNVSGIKHPCPLPLELAERLVLATTKPGDLVVDPFAGSGTILVAAIKHGRRALGFEISEQYANLANSRIGAECGHLTVGTSVGTNGGVNANEILELSEKILRLRAELQEAETQLQQLATSSQHTKAKPAAAAGTVRAAGSLPPVAQRVAKVLAARGALAFGDIFTAVQPAKRGAVKSALQAGRGRGEYVLTGDKYQYKKKGPGGSSSRADGVVSLEAT